MNDQKHLVPLESRQSELADPMSTYSMTVSPPNEESEITPLQRIHSLLRGRYLLAVVLGMVFGLMGGILGWFAFDPIYRNEGVIRIKPFTERILEKTEQSEVMPGYQGFLKTQISLITADRVVDEARRRPAWSIVARKLGRRDTFKDRENFKDSIEVDNPPGTQLIMVRFRDKNAEAAKAGARALIEAYDSLYVADDLSSFKNKLDQVGRIIEQVRSDRRSKKARIEALTEEFGGTDVEPFYQMQIRKFQTLEQQHTQLMLIYRRLRQDEDRRGFIPRHIQLQNEQKKKNEAKDGAKDAGNSGAKDGGGGAADDATAPKSGDGAKAGDVQPGNTPMGDGKAAPNARPAGVANIPPDIAQTLASLTVESVAEKDPIMRGLLNQRDLLKRQMYSLKQNYGPLHKTVRDAEVAMEAVEKSIQDRFQEYQKLIITGGGAQPEINSDQVYEQLLFLQTVMGGTQKTIQQLGKKSTEAANLKEQVDYLDEQLKLAQDRRRALEIEKEVRSRIEIVQRDGGLQEKPWRNRRIFVAPVLGMMGAGFGVALVVLLGLLNRRLRNYEDARDSLGRRTMLGILPEMPEDLSDPEQADIADHCVHQIRTLLQIGAESHGRRVFSITSPAAFDGKTSLGLALGISFAKSGSKTLLVDCDMTDGDLSTRVNTIIRRKVGRILVSQGLVTETQVEEALAKAHNRRLGEVLIEMGFVSRGDLDQALVDQERMPVGLVNALEGEPVEDCVANTGFDGLDILPVGESDMRGSSRISPSALRAVLNEARQLYDIVIIDSGPVPSSIEASHAAAESDGVVMVVSRNLQRDHAERAVEHLDAIGARVAGVVFNRANASEVRALSEGGADTETTSRPRRLRSRDTVHTKRFGPVAGAVARGSRNGDAADEEPGE